MRTEKEVIDTLLNVAVEDESVRAIIRTDLFPNRGYD